eukprot:5372785-Prymnesium_polylepis.1
MRLFEVDGCRIGSGFGGGGGGTPSSKRSGRWKRLACAICDSSASITFLRCFSVSLPRLSPIAASVCLRSSGSRSSLGRRAWSISWLSCSKEKDFGSELSHAAASAERSSSPSLSLPSLTRPEIIGTAACRAGERAARDEAAAEATGSSGSARSNHRG